MSISMIWAMGANGVIGKDNDMPWHLPRDFAFFKSETFGKRMLMGRKTWESLGGKPLKDRTSIIITRDRSYARREQRSCIPWRKRWLKAARVMN